jgi:hypothetical protein
MKKNNTAQKAALEVEQLSKALKEGTEKTLRNLLKEAIEDIVNDDEEETQDAEPIEDDSFEVQDVETGETSEETPEEGSEDEPGVDAPESDEEGGADEWGDEYDEFKVGDNEYDFTGVDGDLALKIFQSLSDDDQINVKKDEEGNIEVSDGETGAEIVIELTPGEGSAEDSDFDADVEGEPENDEFDAEPEDGDNFASEPEGDFGGDSTEDDDEEIEIDLGGDDEESSDEELNEDLGYTDSYQKDVMPGLNMSEPADKKSTNDWDEGVPTGNKKPWAGKHNEKDYKETHTDLAEGAACPKCGKTPCECGKELDENQTTAKAPRRKQVKTAAPNSGETDKPEVSKEVSVAGQLTEAKAQKILEAAKAIQAENKQIKALAGKLRESLEAAATLNVNYGKIVNLLVNESTTKEEKLSIIERFSGVKTVKEGAILYESIKRELNESNKKNAANVLNEQISAESSKTINETPIYQTSANNRSIALMERMDNLSNYNHRGLGEDPSGCSRRRRPVALPGNRLILMATAGPDR